MVPMPMSTAQQRCRNLAEQNSSISSRFAQKVPQRPTITYGKKDTRPLPLTANQFRPSPYAIPSDDEDEQQAKGDALLQAAGQGGVSEASEDSELSDAEPMRTCVPKKAIVHSKPRSNAGVLKAFVRAPESSLLASTARSRKAPLKPVQTPRSRSAYRIAASQRSMSKGNISVSKGNAKAKSKTATPARRLPVNELFLVSSPVDYTVDNEPASSYHVIQTQDPINDESSPPRKRRVSTVSSVDDDGRVVSKTLLSAIRKHLKTPKLRHKSLSGLQRKQGVQGVWSTVELAKTKGRDGFDDSELAITSYSKVERPRKRKEHLIPGFVALQLQSGPLPEVDFQPTATQLKMETPAPDDDEQYEEHPCDQEDDDAIIAPVRSSPQRSRQQVSFSDRVREDLIRAQLSSISAPARLRSESEESDVGEGENADEEVEDGEESGFDEHYQPTPDEDNLPGHQLSDVRRDNLDVPRSDQGPEQVNEGVNLDFWRLTGPGRGPGPSFGKLALIEVNESIVKVPESDQQDREYTHGPNRLGEQFQAVGQPRRHRPRSILKNCAQVVPDSTTMPEQTAANTRRNSMVDAAESTYFTKAANILRSPDPTRHKIIPRRRSSYIDRADVQVVNSEAAVPETFLEPPEYTTLSDLNVLRRSSEAVWTSSSLPTAVKDLKTLTRSVSREHGTLSQSMRRRPSLPFQSTNKIQ